MPLIPMKQTVIVTKGGGTDGWGQPVPSAVVPYKARVVGETNVVKNRYGEEAVTGLRITLDKLPDITYDDVIDYTDDLGVTIRRNPVSIAVKRGMNGRPILTEVFV